MKSSVIAALVLALAWFGSPSLSEAGMNHPPHNVKKFMGVDKEHRGGDGESITKRAELNEVTASMDRREKKKGPSRKVKHKWGMP